jgi:hypothetical protein
VILGDRKFRHVEDRHYAERKSVEVIQGKAKLIENSCNNVHRHVKE